MYLKRCFGLVSNKQCRMIKDLDFSYWVFDFELVSVQPQMCSCGGTKSSRPLFLV